MSFDVYFKTFFYTSKTKILSTLTQFYEWHRWGHGQHTELIDGSEAERATQGMHWHNQLPKRQIDSNKIKFNNKKSGLKNQLYEDRIRQSLAIL